ncbi:MAG: T9SS type A sorting domain-containing protein [Phycisphaerae bacterium]|nr:T9SS type A sorting domain-containing protein [candidate division KSB1 bacterium]NIV00264.1 T9SS type A sorting domain-containing protein [Phycisphaerae bacterium]NIT70207.1 T9SS type A sorting domain-containing protein [candidate division KSB1 bacterium]NIU23859.1 T9SS type A sorting domain-containing protein [candidate division KSB1 bacterium]NIV69124.1 T9SS type A sorting domain-containing protein [Phycisphaerae bacterium]
MNNGKNLWLNRGSPWLTLLLLVMIRPPMAAQPVMLVKDINPGLPSGIVFGSPNLTDVNGTLFFVANEQTNGRELWKSDGTVGGTVLVKDINPGSTGSIPLSLANVNGTLFFSADDGVNGRELWKSDGTAAGTVLVKDINLGMLNPTWLTNVNGTLFFSAGGRELWKSDGTTAGTVLVKVILAGLIGSGPSELTNVNGVLFFVADDSTTGGEELWKSDGTAGGTQVVKIINPSGSFPIRLTPVNSTLFFSASDGSIGYELWKSDGTAAGTVLVKDINPFGGSISLFGPGVLSSANGILFFAADDGVNGEELWQSDGTTVGTVLVKDIQSGASGSSPRELTNVNGTIFFQADDGVSGLELWQSDGTTAGTVLVKDIRPGVSASNPSELTSVNGTVFFHADDGTSGRELWQSDGTPSGTILVEDINPGSNDSDPRALTDVSGTLFFAADDGVLGKELWVGQSPIVVTLTPINPPIQIPPGGGQFQFTITLNNISGRSEQTQVWNQIILPDGSTFGPTIGPVTLDIPSGQSRTRTLTQEIPAGAPAGQYTYMFNVGTFPDTIDDSDSFPFTKLSPTSASWEFSTWRVLDATNQPVTANDWEFVTAETVQEEPVPEEFGLEQNYPNPFNPATTISYQLPQAEKVSIVIYDLIGRQVRELINRNQEAGVHSVKWDGRDQARQTVAAGVYIYKITAGQFSQVRKMVLVK